MIHKLSLLIIVTAALVLGPAAPSVHYTPRQGDYFTYYEIVNLANGTGNYQGYTEHMTISGKEVMNSVSGNGVVSAHYNYSYIWGNSTGQTETGKYSGNYTFSSDSFLYLNGTDDQTGYVNPTVWFYMNNTIPVGGTFYLLNTEMTVSSLDYSYHLPSQNRNVKSIFAQGSSSYLRNDSYGIFNAQYTWDTYFDPSTGYILGYQYLEHDSNSSGSGFTYTDILYVNSTSYPLTPFTGSSPVQSNLSPLVITGVAIAAVAVIVVIAMAILIRKKREHLPKHSGEPAAQNKVPYPPPDRPEPVTGAPTIDLTPKQPPVQQIVIKEVVKVKCSYCGALIDSTAQTCPECGAPRT
ncbi:MAG: zinc ribbon domain-containing protein [Candidatus Thermoplasmatota archaeon]|jgi:hypothetical protein|nr:zinc ribbon domain-containing protein [Candidatus Thermoplasmatota archaeon]